MIGTFHRLGISTLFATFLWAFSLGACLGARLSALETGTGLAGRLSFFGGAPCLPTKCLSKQDMFVVGVGVMNSEII